MRSVKSPLLRKHSNLLHAFSTKVSGYSLRPFAQNNLAYHVNDDPLTVYKNHLNYARYLDYNIKNLVYMEQIHGDKIVVIDKNTDVNKIPKCDALITDQKDIPLMVMVADCIPILIYDPIKEVIATVHAGRAGVFLKIVTKTIQVMRKSFKSSTQDLIVVLGPSIRSCCYEVGLEIKEEAQALGYKYAITKKDSSYYLDLISIVKKELKGLNVNKDNIDVSPYCTSCNNDIFFSYRAEKNTSGRFSGVLMLKN